MATIRPEILWSPNIEDNFLTWSTNIQLYQVQNVSVEDVISAPKFSLGNKTAANLLATNSEYQYIKCVAWYNGFIEEGCQHIIAVGQANGRVALTSFNRSSDSHVIIGKEFAPKPARAVNALAFNQKFHQYLAVGLDKATRDQSVVVLDVVRGFPSSIGHESRSTSSSELLKPVMEWSPGETVHSVEFSKNNPVTLLSGSNNKQIKLFDLREEKLVSSVGTKAVHGICSDPFNKDRFASHVDNVVYIWDLRNIDRPVLTLTDCNSKAIHKLSWCPTRYGFLGSLSRESPSIRLYDIQQHGTTTDEELPVIRRSITAEPNSFVSSFSWHPTHENRVITTSYSGKVLDHIVHERVTLNWSVMNNLGFSSGKRIIEYLEEDHLLFENLCDISTLMKERALKQYGLHMELSLNGEVTGDATLRSLWLWLHEARQLAQNPHFKMPKGGHYEYQGVLSILKMGSLKSDVSLKSWEGVESNKITPAKIFKSEERNLALALCSWGTEEDGSLERFLNQLESKEMFTRAAAVAIFNSQLPTAIKILKKGSVIRKELTLNVTAMALAGFTSERKGLWRETCGHLLKQFDDPYLKASFAFLTGETETFDPILNDKRITIYDRVAFACKYLSDARLLEYVNKLAEDLIEDGNLNGILLTGLDTEGIDLLQRYLDITGDVQTPSLIAIHALQNRFSTETRVQHWLDSYRSLLDSLKLWKERARVDVIMNQSSEEGIKIPQQIYMSCNFCSKSSTSAYSAGTGRSRLPFARFGTGATSKLKMTTCPSCRKPLPRCSLCLQHMGTPSRRGSVTGASPKRDDNKRPNADESRAMKVSESTKTLSKFSSWFSWCQACLHGGHAQHMIQWFKEHNECPVTSCGCKCMNIDGFNRTSATIKQ